MKKSNFKEMSFLDSGTNISSWRMPAILTLLKHHCCVNNNKIWFVAKKIKIVIKVLSRVMGRISLSTNEKLSLSSLNKLLTKSENKTGSLVLCTANPAVVKSAKHILLRTLIQLRSWH